MQLYGLMITRDEDAIFADWCRQQLPLYDAVVCLDGSERDHTAVIARAFAGRLLYLHERDYAIAHKTDHGLRRVVHEEITHRFGTANWVMCCHADEFCYHDPRKVAARAAAEGYDGVAWFSLHFYPHPDDLSDWDRLRTASIPERVRHYHWNHHGRGFPWLEYRLYRNGTDVAWDESTHGSTTPHNLHRPAPFHPILRHFKVLSVDLEGYERRGASSVYRSHWQGLQHRTGLPFRVERPEDFFVRSIANYTCCDRFDGRIEHSWNMGEEYRPDPTKDSRPLR